jgi:hypothetical protein
MDVGWLVGWFNPWAMGLKISMVDALVDLDVLP